MITVRQSRMRIAVASVAILVLMLSSPIAGVASSDIQAEQASSQSSPPPAGQPTAPPQQSSPGQLSYTNTWDRTEQATCPPVTEAVDQQPLVAQKAQTWSLTSSVPLILTGNDVMSGQSIQDTYVAFSNGTFVSSDNQGNAISWPGVTGLPSGATAIKLYGNSTEALQLYSIGAPGHLVANFTVAYSLMETSGCEPHGLTITIQGWATWPSDKGGTLRLGFRGAQVWANSTQAAFGGNGGSRLVFDWSDSMKADPTSYQNQTETVSWSVGGTFKIDPTIIGTSSSQQALNWGDQRKLWHTTEANGTVEYWAFYFDGSNIIRAWSLNGVSWHTSYFDSTLAPIASDSQFSSWVNYNDGVYTLYFVLTDPVTGGFFLGVGQLGNNGAVNSLVSTWYTTVWPAGDSYPCIYGSSSGVVVGVATSQSGSYQLEVYDVNPSTTKVLSKVAVSTGSLPDGCIALGVTSGYALLYGAATTGSPVKVITSTNGNSWSTPTTASTTAAITMSSAVAVGNTVDFATVTGAGEVYWNCAYPCTSTSSVLTLAPDSGGVIYDNVVLSTNGRGGGTSITATYHSLSEVWSRTSDDGGNSWTPPQLIGNGSTGLIESGSLQADYDYVEGGAIVATTDVAWVTGTSAPYDIWFPAYPVVVPSAATTSDPWAMSGYSPYESYFSQLSEYVSPGNGLLGVSQTDLAIPGRSPALSIARVFSTPSAFVGTQDAKVPYGYDNYTLSDLGIGWALAFPWIGSDYFHPGDGASIPLSFNSSGIMEYHGAVDFVLYKNSNDTYTLYTADGTRYAFAGLKLVSITSPDSPLDSLTFSYNTTPGYITQIQDGEGRVVAFGYNANNTLASISSGGQTWKYTYKGSDLASVTDPLGDVTRYYYASYNPWLISEIAYPTGAATYYTYETGLVAPDVSTYAVYGQYEYISGSSQLLARSDTYLFNMVDGSMVSAQVLYNDSDAFQGSSVFDFRNVNGKYVELESQKDQSGNVISSVETDFDQDGRPNQTILFSPSGSELAYSVTHYDEWGNVNFTQDYDGHDEYFAYANTQDQYQFGNGKTELIQDFYTNSTIDKHTHTDLLGSAEFQNAANTETPIEAFYLYSNGEVLKESQLYIPSSGATRWLTTSFTYDAYGNLQTVTDPLDHQTCYVYSSTYDSAYLTSEIASGSANCHAAPNVTVSSTYDFATGDLTSQTDGEGNTTAYSYDALGRLTSVMYPEINGVRATTSYSYNDATNVVTATDERGNITKYYYDGLGRLTQEQTFISPTSSYSSEYFTYNWLGEVLTDEKPNGGTYTYAYDSLGRVVEETVPTGTQEYSSYNVTTNTVTEIDGNGHETQNVYDFMQQLVAVREYWSGGGYNATAYTYDGVGNLVKVVGPNANQVTQYSYDDLNRLVKTTYADGTTQKASYDAVGDLTSTTDQEGRVTTYSYDHLYRLSAVHYPDGTSTTYTYDNDGNVLTMKNGADQVKYSYDALNDLLSETDTIGGVQYTISYTYDLAGNVQSISYPDGSKVSYSYDALDRVTKVYSGTSTYASFTYNYDSTINSITYGDGEVTKYSYDSMSRPTSMVAMQGSTQELSLTYKYDNAGNVVSIDSESFGYDPLDRLTSASGPWGTTTYSYDAAGNMVQKTNSSSSTTTMDSYNSMDELVRSSTASGATTYSYDGDGDLVIKNDGTNVWTYDYNTQSELTKVFENGVLVQQNYYDGSGNRVEQTTGATTTLYLYADNSILYEKNLQTGASTKHVYANGLQVASITTSTVSFLHQDELGSTRLVTGSGSSPAFSSDYLPYGVQYGSSGTEEFMYTGQLYDAATGLYYFNARFYDPSTGRFLTVDPLGGVQADPQSLNGYAYARDNPLAIVDPSGLSWSLATSLLFGAAVGLGIVSALQLGLDPITDALDAAAIGDFAASLATVTAIGGGINLAANTALSGGQVGWSTVGLSFGFAALGVVGGEGEDDEPIPEQLQGILRTTDRTDAAEDQLAEIFGGERQMTLRTGTWMGNRMYDVWAEPNTARELKFGDDPVTIIEIQKDVQLRDYGGTLVRSGRIVDSVDVTYDFVSDPVTGNSVSQRSLNLLNEYGIPYQIWGPEFWESWG
jgi:RHS repeat-associated protein